MKINSKKLLDFLKSQNCEPIFKKFYQETGGFLKAGNLEIYGNFRKDNGFFSGEKVDFTTLEQSADRGEKVEVEIVEFGTKRRKAKSLADIVKNFDNSKSGAKMVLEKLKKGLQRYHQENLKNEDFFVNEENYTAADLIVRRYLNDGTSGFGMVRVAAGYQYILKNKQALIDNNMLSKDARNNYGFELWTNYKI